MGVDEDRPGLAGGDQAVRDLHVERKGRRTVLRRLSVGPEVELHPGARRGLVQEERDGHRAQNATPELRVGVVDRGGDRVTRARGPDGGERGVADVDHPPRRVRLARRGEVPRELEVLRGDAVLLQAAEDVLVERTARRDRDLVRGRSVAERGEDRARLDGLSARVDHAADGDEVARGVLQANRGADHEGLARRLRRAHVELGEMRNQRAGVGLHQHGRRRGLDRGRDMVGVGQALRRRPGEVGDDVAPWREAVSSQKRGQRRGRLALRTRERGLAEVHVLPGRHRRVGHRPYR